MKKTVAILLSLVVAVTFASCKNKKEDNIRGTVAEIELGTSVNNKYTSEFIGIGCTLDSQWYFLSNEELLELNRFSEELEGDELEKEMEDTDIVYDMVAESGDSTQKITVCLQNFGLVYGKAVNEDEYIAARIEGLKAGYKNLEVDNFFVKKTGVTFCGKERKAISCSYEMEGLSVYQKQVLIKVGKYIAIVTAETYIEDTTDRAIGYFYSL